MDIPLKPLILPPLPYSYDGLEPVTSALALKIHYEGHHGGYVKKFNEILKNGGSKENLEFNYSGHILHSVFWQCFSPFATSPNSQTLDIIANNFPGYYPVEDFLNQLVETAMKIKGSGWAVVTSDDSLNLKISSIANHDLGDIEGQIILLLDSWEHSFYLDFANQKEIYFKAIINLINWDIVSDNLSRASLGLL